MYQRTRWHLFLPRTITDECYQSLKESRKGYYEKVAEPKVTFNPPTTTRSTGGSGMNLRRGDRVRYAEPGPGAYNADPIPNPFYYDEPPKWGRASESHQSFLDSVGYPDSLNRDTGSFDYGGGSGGGGGASGDYGSDNGCGTSDCGGGGDCGGGSD